MTFLVEVCSVGVDAHPVSALGKLLVTPPTESRRLSSLQYPVLVTVLHSGLHFVTQFSIDQ